MEETYKAYVCREVFAVGVTVQSALGVLPNEIEVRFSQVGD